MGIDREEKRVTGRNEPSQPWEKETEQLDTNDPNQRRLLENTLLGCPALVMQCQRSVHFVVATLRVII
jgi:hypothetical protein